MKLPVAVCGHEKNEGRLSAYCQLESKSSPAEDDATEADDGSMKRISRQTLLSGSGQNGGREWRGGRVG